MSLFSNVNVSHTLPDDTKVIKLIDEEKSCEKSVKVPAQRADEFVATRTTFIKDEEKKLERNYFLFTAFGGVIGGIFSLLSKQAGSKLKKAGANGLIGAATGLSIAAIMSPFKVYNVQNKLNKMDEQFIKNNS